MSTASAPTFGLGSHHVAGVFYKDTGEMRIYMDGGNNWNAVNTGLTNPWVAALAIDPRNPATLYAGTHDGGMFKSLDGGNQWGAFNDGLTSLWVEALVIDPKNPATLFAGTKSGVFDIQQQHQNYLPIVLRNW